MASLDDRGAAYPRPVELMAIANWQPTQLRLYVLWVGDRAHTITVITWDLLVESGICDSLPYLLPTGRS